MTVQTTAQTTAQSGAQLGGLLDGLDITVVEAGPATLSRKCSTDNGCDTLAGGDC